MQELTLIRSELQGERDALHTELSEATDANRDLSSRLDAANAALQQLKQEMENRLRDADEEIDGIRYVNHRTTHSAGRRHECAHYAPFAVPST